MHCKKWSWLIMQFEKIVDEGKKNMSFPSIYFEIFKWHHFDWMDICCIYHISKLFKSLIPQNLKINHTSTSIVIIHQQVTKIAPQRMSMSQV
jgi:hypothetical protein